MPQHTLLIATANAEQRALLAAHLDADGHTVHSADGAPATTAKLCAHAIDVLVLAELARVADSLTLLRALRAGRLHTRIHPAQPVITIGAGDDLATLHAYEAGSDHHLGVDAGYLVLRAVIDAIARRTTDQVTSRHLHVGELHIDTAAHTATVAGEPVKLSRLEFQLLATLATDPSKLFTKAELQRKIWSGRPTATRTIDSHASRLRRNLAVAGAPQLVCNVWGSGYRLCAQ
jgi:DNA-binding response OmpR family regulator